MPEAASYEPTLADAPAALPTDKCNACGAPLDLEDAFCTACGAPHRATVAVGDDRPEAFVEAELLAQGTAEDFAESQRHFRCQNCGAEVATDPDHRSYVCPFCDSTYVVEFPASENPRQAPNFVIGFGVTTEQAHALYHDWISDNGWLQPNDLKTAQVEEKLKGVYLPFWAFSMLAESGWHASIGEYWYKTETYTTWEKGKMVRKTRRVQQTEWWELAGRHHRYYSGYLVSGSKGLPQPQADRIQPFQLAALKRYQPYFLAGWLCEEYSIDQSTAQATCEQQFYREERANVAAFMPGDTHRNLVVNTHFAEASGDLVLLPVYLLSYRYNDKLYRFLINGQTGKVAGDKPISPQRVAALVGAIAGAFLIVVLLMMLLFFVK